jgi:hypothetical protein
LGLGLGFVLVVLAGFHIASTSFRFRDGRCAASYFLPSAMK